MGTWYDQSGISGCKRKDGLSGVKEKKNELD